MTGLTVNFTNHCTVDIGAYAKSNTNAIITNGNNDKKHACIAMGSSVNRKGYFDLDTGRVVVLRTFKQMICPYRLLTKAKTWGKKGKNAILKDQIKFLNQKWEKFALDNNNLTEIEMADKKPKLVQPNFIAEITGIEVKSDYKPRIGQKPNGGIQLYTTFGQDGLNQEQRTYNVHQTDNIQTHIRRSKCRREVAIRAPQNIKR